MIIYVKKKKKKEIFGIPFIIRVCTQLPRAPYVHRPGPGQPVRRRVHQRPAVAQPHTAEDRRNGRGRGPAVRHIQTVARVARLRVENPEPVPGDGQHQARRDRRQQAEGGHAGRGAPDRGVQDGKPRDIQLGNTRQVPIYTMRTPICRSSDSSIYVHNFFIIS